MLNKLTSSNSLDLLHFILGEDTVVMFLIVVGLLLVLVVVAVVVVIVTITPVVLIFGTIHVTSTITCK